MARRTASHVDNAAQVSGETDRVIGVVSFGSGCAGELPVMVYTRVSAYSGWIAETMRQQ